MQNPTVVGLASYRGESWPPARSRRTRARGKLVELRRQRILVSEQRVQLELVLQEAVRNFNGTRRGLERGARPVQLAGVAAPRTVPDRIVHERLRRFAAPRRGSSSRCSA